MIIILAPVFYKFIAVIYVITSQHQASTLMKYKI